MPSVPVTVVVDFPDGSLRRITFALNVSPMPEGPPKTWTGVVEVDQIYHLVCFCATQTATVHINGVVNVPPGFRVRFPGKPIGTQPTFEFITGPVIREYLFSNKRFWVEADN